MLWPTLRRVAASRAFAAKRAAVLASDNEKESPSLHNSASGGVGQITQQIGWMIQDRLLRHAVRQTSWRSLCSILVV
jgi:hypothetical protein